MRLDIEQNDRGILPQKGGAVRDERDGIVARSTAVNRDDDLHGFSFQTVERSRGADIDLPSTNTSRGDLECQENFNRIKPFFHKSESKIKPFRRPLTAQKKRPENRFSSPIVTD